MSERPPDGPDKTATTPSESHPRAFISIASAHEHSQRVGRTHAQRGDALGHGQEKEFVRTLEQLLQPKPQAPSSPPEISTPPVLLEDPNLLKLPEHTSDPISKTLQVGVEYFKTHRDHLHDERNADQGAPVGSGSVESLCGQRQNRFKRTGQFWSPIGLRNLLSLDVLHRNNDLHCLWN